MGQGQIDRFINQCVNNMALAIDRCIVNTILGCDPESFKKSLLPIFIAYQDKDGYHEVYPPKNGVGTNNVTILSYTSRS